ncbi:MAG: zinc ribbon domain-containing protein [Candidatus Glassbacteria bacterium]|nr:zinc ribbon domain-containing protein [Candidatus Glassbacteria bacterium]
MPIYEYQCKSCGKRFEVLQGINETPELSCDKCDGTDIQRILSPVAFVFKGSGFYATDYKNKGKGKAKEQAPACADSGRCPSAASDS